MKNTAKEDNNIIEENLKYIGLDLKNIPDSLLNVQRVKYKPVKTYEDNNYKIYKYIDINDIDIYITPADRLDDLNDKLKKSLPLAIYLDDENEKTEEQYQTFIEMLNNLDIEKLEEIEKQQEVLSKKMPYEIKYNNNYIWQIYYSDLDDKYFMLHSSNEKNSEALFYLIKKKIQNKNEKIYIPISHLEYSNKVLKKEEIADLENYLWFFTKEWPNIYEVYNNKGEVSIEILGKTKVYDDVKSTYKITLENKKHAQDVFKLIKALFILQSNDEMEYEFKPILNDKGTIDFCYNLGKISYDNLSEFIKQEIETKQDKIQELCNDNIISAENLELLKTTVEKQKEEYLSKEKQIANFLECRKTFFGRMKFFFKKGKKVKDKENDKDNNKDDKKINKKKTDDKQDTDSIKESKNSDSKNVTIEKIEKKDLYTIEELLKICGLLKVEETKYKNIQMDVKALENKRDSFERKIKNATLYINEIESHKKSIFDFWKFTNKDESNMLAEGEGQEDENLNRLKKVFDYEEDIEEFGQKVDIKQRKVFTKDDCDSIFAIRNDIQSFNLLNKKKLLKKDENEIEKTIKKLKDEYEKNVETIENKDFDIFGNVAEDKTKIKTLKNNKHREIEKDKYKILKINPNTTLQDYMDNINNYKNLLNEVYGKMQTPYDISLYKSMSEELDETIFEICDLNPKNEIKSNKEDVVNLYKINVKEKMPVVFYSNIMFFDNINKTLPEGMDIETKALIDLSRFDLKLVLRKDFYMNTFEDSIDNKIQLFHAYEYDIEIKNNSI